MLPEPVVTCWTTWLQAAVYYADNLPIVKNIVNNFSGNGLLVSRAKEAVSDPGLAGHLLAIKRDYKRLIPCVEIFESPTYNIITAYQDFTSMDLAQDSCNIKQYVTKRLESNVKFITRATFHKSNTIFFNATR